MLFAGLLLVLVLCLMSVRVQRTLQSAVHRRPASIFAAPLLLSCVFLLAAATYGAFSAALAGMVAVYTLLPTCYAYVQANHNRDATLLDLVTILLLWLPLEFGVGSSVVPRLAQPVLHAVAYGISVTLGLLLFLIFRHYDGMKYNLPRAGSDYRNALLGFALAGVTLIPLGLAVGFLLPWHSVRHSTVTVATRIPLIFVATALPEEILFRSMIQNWLVQRVRPAVFAIILAALVFGSAHLDNGPGPLPNWSYAIVATGAGFIFGQVFHRSTSVVASAVVHTGVNTVKWLFF
jgi:membrane protease YdiL (CAAX protease family)